MTLAQDKNSSIDQGAKGWYHPGWWWVVQPGGDGVVPSQIGGGWGGTTQNYGADKFWTIFSLFE
jgi:hypothetical protein